MVIYLKEKRATLIVFLCCALIYFVTFALYHFPLEAVLYPTILCALIIAGVFFFEWRKAKNKHEELNHLQSLPDHLLESLGKYETTDDKDYRELLRLVTKQAQDEHLFHQRKMSDSVDYYTTWVHQIKTPIASMRLRLQAQKDKFSSIPQENELSSALKEDKLTSALQEDKLNSALLEDLFRIEQYVEMVMTYIRLGSDSTDYVFRECALDGVIKGCLRKYAGQFIGKGLSLQYEETDQIVLTDEKWLSFVIEQLLSNAIKYTEQGGVTIEVSNELILSIRDTGYGISAEDLPRIFEKGYTGFRGREDKQASGIGLFLCKQTCDNLGVKIWAESEVGVGTTIYLDLSQKKTIHE